MKIAGLCLPLKPQKERRLKYNFKQLALFIKSGLKGITDQVMTAVSIETSTGFSGLKEFFQKIG